MKQKIVDINLKPFIAKIFENPSGILLLNYVGHFALNQEKKCGFVLAFGDTTRTGMLIY